MEKGINVLSLFDGMSCGRIALEKAGIKVNNYFSSEIKELALKVANRNYPQDISNRLGNILTISGKDLPHIDLLIGGSPCQDFSQANKERLGDKGAKSGLFYEYIRVLNEVDTTFFLLENVKMKKEHQDIISNILGCEPIKINSKLLSPQLRNRLYWTNMVGVTIPKDTNLKLNDFLINGYSDRTKARALLVSDSRPLTTPIKMAHRYFNTGFTTLIFKNEEHFKAVKKHFDKHFKGLSAIEIDLYKDSIDLSIYEGVRYMTKRERESCQTVPLGYTSEESENEAADLLGDGWTVAVIAHILKNIKKYKKLCLN